MAAAAHTPPLTTRLRVGAAKWWRLGPYHGTAEALRLWSGNGFTALRRTRLRARPLTVSAADVKLALGAREPAEVFRTQVLPAMPAVAAFERELGQLDEQARADLLARADDILEHRFDVLGSGPTPLGPGIDWQLDFKTGRRWPLVHISKLPFSYDDGSDIKVAWELSRFQHLPLLAGAWRLSGDRRYLDELAAQLDDWIDSNPVEFGANWYCTMDVAIRAANWVAALALCAGDAAGRPWFERALGSLLLHGRFIRGHLEWFPDTRGNHYLSNLAGLSALAALFAGGDEGRGWAEWLARELVVEMEHQVRPDGCDHEASIAYHRLVCEFFVVATQAVDALLPGALPEPYRRRLDRMLGFVADYTRPDGLAPQIGDADDGRLIPLGDYASSDVRSHLHLFRQAGRAYTPASEPAGYPDGGYYVVRGGDMYGIVRCGDVGMYGLGAHSHNDQLSFELAVAGQPLIVDPGAYIYKSDPVGRNTFRSTAFHSTLRVGGAEQNELPTDRIFTMPDRSRSEAILWEPEGMRCVFEGRHHGFEVLDPPATHTRRFEFDCAARTVLIRDTVAADGAHDLEWTFPLAPSRAVAEDGAVTAEFDGVRLTIEAEGVEFAVEEGWISPSYGVRLPTPFVRARRRGRPGNDVTEFLLRASGA